MRIPLGVIVKDKVTGFVGVAENRATFLYGCDRYCVQPRVGEDGKIPDSAMIDEPQLEIVEGEDRVMEPAGEPKQLVKFGELVFDPVAGVEATVMGRAVYLNGCSRIYIKPKRTSRIEDGSYWVYEAQVEKKGKVVKEPSVTTTSSTRPGGPAISSSKF